MITPSTYANIDRKIMVLPLPLFALLLMPLVLLAASDTSGMGWFTPHDVVNWTIRNPVYQIVTLIAFAPAMYALWLPFKYR